MREQTREALEAMAVHTQPVELDQATQGRLSRLDAISQQQMGQAGRSRMQIALRRIEAALARHAAGEYGVCRRCDEPIAPARLDADPAAPLCIECAGRPELGA